MGFSNTSDADIDVLLLLITYLGRFSREIKKKKQQKAKKKQKAKDKK